jgi:hypothetical protein
MKILSQLKKLVYLVLISTSLLGLQSFKATKKVDPVNVEVSYVGENEEYFLFSFKYNHVKENSSNAKVRVNIVANSQDLIFVETFTSSKMDKTFKINKNDLEKISFQISQKGKHENYNFIVKRIYAEQVDVVVSK